MQTQDKGIRQADDGIQFVLLLAITEYRIFYSISHGWSTLMAIKLCLFTFLKYQQKIMKQENRPNIPLVGL
jgi:hypothetical protein